MELYIGLFFIAGAVPKALNIDRFAVQLAAYKVIETPTWLMAAALFTVFVEISLGTALLLKLRLRGLTIAALQGLLLFFTGLILYSWRYHGLEDCGCFPVIQMPPGISVLKNTLMFAAGCYMGWRFVIAKPVSMPRVPIFDGFKQQLAGAGALKFVFAALLALSAVTYAWQDMDRGAFANTGAGQDNAIFAQFDLYLDEGHFDLGTGVYLVPIISMTCLECIEKSPEINDLFMMPGVPPIVALCYEDSPGDMEQFRAITMPMFPLYSIGDRVLLYYSLIGQEPFRLSLVKDGRLIHVWDGYVPTYEALIEVLESLDVLS